VSLGLALFDLYGEDFNRLACFNRLYKISSSFFVFFKYRFSRFNVSVLLSFADRSDIFCAMVSI